jgi:MFS family permease
VAGALARAGEALAGRDFRKLLASRLTSSAGDGFFNAAVIGSAAFSTNQHTAAGLARALAILIIPYSLIGPFTGVFIDRWSRRKILVWAPVGRALAVIPLAILADRPDSLGFLLAGLLAAGVNRFLSATGSAVVPELVRDEDLIMANSMTSIGSTVTMAVFAFFGGLLVSATSARLVLLVLTVSWVGASAIATRISSDLSAPHASQMRLRHDLARVGTEFIDGARRLWHAPAALAPVVTISLDQLLEGTVFVVSIVVFKERFREGMGSYSYLLASGAVGLAVGVATIGKLEDRIAKVHIVAVALAVSGVALLVATLRITPLAVMVQAFLVGLAYAWKKVPIDTLVQEAVPDDFRGRVFSVYDVGFNLGRVAGTVVTVWLLPTVGVKGTLAACGVVFLVWIPLFLLWVAKPSARAFAEPPQA